nr:hypothetical protein [Tanacetum cinerariifolium]
MASLVDKAILSGAENHPPMLEKDMYDSWRSRMEMYMLNRQHGRIILESVKRGTLLWPSITEEGVTRLKKYSELSAAEAIQANFDVKATNIILQALPSEIYALGSSSSNLSISYPMNETSSTINHNAYMASAPQIDYAPSAHHQLEFSSPETRLVVPVSQKGDDPIEAINHMMSFLTSVVTSRFLATNNQLRTSSNPRQQATINDGMVTIQLIQGRQNHMSVGSSRLFASGSGGTSKRQRDKVLLVQAQANGQGRQNHMSVGSSRLFASGSGGTSGRQRVIVCYNCKGEGHMAKQCTQPKRKHDAEWFKDKVLLVQAQANGQVALMANLSHYGSDNLAEAIVVLDTEDTLMLAKESRSKMIEKQNDPQMIDKKTESSTEQDFWSQYSVQSDEPNLSGTTIVEVPKELPKVSMVNSCLKKLKFHLANFDMVVKERTTATAITEGTRGFEHTKACFRDDIIPFMQSLKELFTYFDQWLIDEVTEVQSVFTQMELAVEQHSLKEQLNKLKGKAVLTKAVSLNPIDPKLLKVDVTPLVPKLRKNRTGHTDYIRHTQEEAATIRKIVESERLLSPLNTSLVYACKYTRRIQELLMILQQTCPFLTDIRTKLEAVTPKNKTKQIRHTAQ